MTSNNDNISTEIINAREKLESLRELMKQNEIDGYFVNTGDQHNNEMLCEHDARRSFISNFNGSAGYALITLEKALLWTDGRYFVQAEKQLDLNFWTLMKAGLPETPTMTDYIIQSTQVKSLGFDSFSTPTDTYLNLKTKFKNLVTLVPFENSLVDIIWGDLQPPFPHKPIFVFPMKYAGVDTLEKVAKIRSNFSKNQVSTLLISQLDEIAWTLNLRGSDIQEHPIFFSYLLITKDTMTLYIKESQLTEEALDKLKRDNVIIKPYDNIRTEIKKFNFQSDSKLWLDSTINTGIYSLISEPEVNIYLGATPVSLAKATKNKAELDGMKEAHIEDAIAEVKFFAWLEIVKKDKSLFHMTEYDLAQKIDELRSFQKSFVSLSFETISGIGKNSAIIHYKPEKDDSAIITPSIYLLDSGGQYKCGTTDITRTTHFGVPTPHEKFCYTLVIKGHIALANAVFPEGTKGPQIDVFARQFLWNEGLDYLHGTGHGVGAFLNVHEGPCAITTGLKGSPSETAFVPGMVLSNEPGYYSYEKAIGIRIENLVFVEFAKTKENFNNRKFYKFQQLTWVPYDTNLLDLSILKPEEIEWINNYHQKVKDYLLPILLEEQEESKFDNSNTIAWLTEATKPISL